MLALGIKPGDEVIVPGFTFVASYSAVIFARAIPVLAEIYESLSLNPKDIEKRIAENTKAIMPVHMMGTPCDMDSIVKIGRRSILGFNFKINELTGAVAIAQLRKIDSITSKLKRKKAKLRERICDLEEISFRKLNDPEADCATLLTLLFPSKEKAEKTASALRTKTLINSGWHVYFNDEEIEKTASSIRKAVL